MTIERIRKILDLHSVPNYTEEKAVSMIRELVVA